MMHLYKADNIFLTIFFLTDVAHSFSTWTTLIQRKEKVGGQIGFLLGSMTLQKATVHKQIYVIYVMLKFNDMQELKKIYLRRHLRRAILKKKLGIYWDGTIQTTIDR